MLLVTALVFADSKAKNEEKIESEWNARLSLIQEFIDNDGFNQFSSNKDVDREYLKQQDICMEMFSIIQFAAVSLSKKKISQQFYNKIYGEYQLKTTRIMTMYTMWKSEHAMDNWQDK